MATGGRSERDKESRKIQDAEKYITEFTGKACRIIVQARCPDAAHTKCALPSKAKLRGPEAWFWLSTPELPADSDMIKTPPTPPVMDTPTWLEIGILDCGVDRTLEIWTIHLKPVQRNYSLSDYKTYGGFCTASKAVSVWSRTLPAHRIAKNVGPNQHTKYRWHHCEPKLFNITGKIDQATVCTASTVLGEVSIVATWQTREDLAALSRARPTAVVNDRYDHYGRTEPLLDRKKDSPPLRREIPLGPIAPPPNISVGRDETDGGRRSLRHPVSSSLVSALSSERPLSDLMVAPPLSLPNTEVPHVVLDQPADLFPGSELPSALLSSSMREHSTTDIMSPNYQLPDHKAEDFFLSRKKLEGVSTSLPSLFPGKPLTSLSPEHAQLSQRAEQMSAFIKEFAAPT